MHRSETPTVTLDACSPASISVEILTTGAMAIALVSGDGKNLSNWTSNAVANRSNCPLYLNSWSFIGRRARDCL